MRRPSDDGYCLSFPPSATLTRVPNGLGHSNIIGVASIHYFNVALPPSGGSIPLQLGQHNISLGIVLSHDT